MNSELNELISRYFDDALNGDEHRQLQEMLRSSPEAVRVFTRSAMLHDRLRAEMQAISFDQTTNAGESTRSITISRWGSWIARVGAVAAFVLVCLVVLDLTKKSVSAETELKRVIAAQETAGDKTYRIAVEETSIPHKQHEKASDFNRPPKPPLDGAVLHARRGNQFVLIREMPGAQRFVTGSNGRTSWAVRQNGPVRVSKDLTRFNRDLPGHEQDIPLVQVEQSLSRLQKAFDVQLLPVENEVEGSGVPTRLLVAVKKRGNRGPQRVEITYEEPTGRIRQIRFVEMPYGPQRLTVRLTLAGETNLGPEFFDHQSHHASDRVVEEE